MPRIGSSSSYGLPAITGKDEKSTAAKVGKAMREKLTLAFDTLLVLSWQLVFRAMHLARRLNY